MNSHSNSLTRCFTGSALTYRHKSRHAVAGVHPCRIDTRIHRRQACSRALVRGSALPRAAPGRYGDLMGRERTLVAESAGEADAR